MKDRDYKSQELLRAGWKKMEGMRGWWYRPGAVSPPTDLDQAFDNERLFPEKVRIALQRKADGPSRPVKSKIPVWVPGIPSAPAKRYKTATNGVAEFVVDIKTGRSVARYPYGQFVNPRELATRYADHLNHFDTAACAAERASIDRAFNENIDLEIAYLNKVRAAIGDDKKLKELISGQGRKDLRYSVVPCGVLRRLGIFDIR